MKNLFWVTDIYFEIWASPPVLRILRRNSKIKVKVKSLSRVQLFTTPWTVARQVSSVHGILQARIPAWVAIPFCRGSSQPRDRTWVSWIEGRLFTALATRDVSEQPRCPLILHLSMDSMFTLRECCGSNLTLKSPLLNTTEVCFLLTVPLSRFEESSASRAPSRAKLTGSTIFYL